MQRVRRWLGAAFVLVAGLVLASGATRVAAADGPAIVVLPAPGAVDDALAGYLADGIADAAAAGAPAVIVRLDTFGGSLEATGRITSTFLEAPLPVIVWVAPAGGRAASAGTFITLAANLAFMAPGTNIGAASPVDSSGADIPGTLGEKVRNDAVAKIRAIAEARGRPVPWAVATVAEARSSSAEEAVAAGAVDGVAATLGEVIAAADGRMVTVAGASQVLALAGIPTSEVGMDPIRAFLHLLADPNLAFALLLLGILGIAFEFLTANLVTGTLGAVALVLAFVGFGSLPLNLAGVVLIAIGIVLLVLEANTPSHGLLTVGAGACVGFGAAVLYAAPDGPTLPDAAVAAPLIALVVAMTLAFGALVSVTAMRTRGMTGGPTMVGTLQVVGTTGKVSRPIDPVGTVHAAGEHWSARSATGRPIPRGERVQVVRQAGLVLWVEPAPESQPDPPKAGTAPPRPAP